jgi:putative sugar O-methyltransferase
MQMSSTKPKQVFVSEVTLLAGASDYLRRDNPRIQELQRRYENHPASHHSLWSPRYLVEELKLDRFRADNAYVHQRRAAGDPSYILTAQYVQSVDKLGLLDTLGDDDLFGNYLVSFNGNLLVGRDLLDAVLEINFLNDNLSLARLDDMVILDIGAGYGRLAHRLVQALPKLKTVLCTDAIPESTFLCEFYLKFRGCESKAKVVPLDEIGAALENQPVDLAINIHSFGECTLRSIEWWLDLVSAHRIKYLFIVPNGEALHSWEADDARMDYLPLLLERGYKMIVKQPNYAGALRLQKHGLYPCYHYLFERN